MPDGQCETELFGVKRHQTSARRDQRKTEMRRLTRSGALGEAEAAAELPLQPETRKLVWEAAARKRPVRSAQSRIQESDEDTAQGETADP